MSFFSGLNFYVYLFVLLIPAVIIGLSEYRLRGYRTFLTILFIYFVFKDTPQQLVSLLIYSIGAVFLVKIFAWTRKKYGRNKYLYWISLLIAILPLVISKVSSFRGTNILGFLGISYICFRVVQVIIEMYDGVIEDIDAFTFLNYLLFFPTLSSGPIDRNRRFEEDDRAVYTRQEYSELLGNGLQKIALGMVYKVVLSRIFFDLLNNMFAERYDLKYVVGYAYVYGVYLFFDFAGYSAMAIGTSYILGIQVPENFNKPFMSIDIKDFWNRWHITLSTWFRDFIFTRFLIDSVRNKRFKNRLNAAVAAFIVNMGIMGIWHGLETHYIVYGLYHGLLLAVTEVYQKKSAFYKKYKNDSKYKLVSWLITMNLVMFGFLIFSGHIGEVWNAVSVYF